MQAIVYQRYGEAQVLQYAQVDTPTPTENEVRVSIRCSSVTAADTLMRLGSPWYGRLFLGLLTPKYPITGTGFSGVVDKIGSNVTGFAVGDRVYGESVLGAGTNCEYVCVSQDAVITHSPAALADHELAPVCDGLLTSCYFLYRLGRLKAGQRILINGAAGSLGSAAVQLARLRGAHVTAVCSTANHDFVRELGADEVIDYRISDFTAQGTSYDVIYDAVGKRSFKACRQVLNKQGLYLSPCLSGALLLAMLTSKYRPGQKALFAATGMLPEAERREMLNEINHDLASGELRTITPHRFSLPDAVRAHRLIETGHRRGNVVLDVAAD